MSPFPFYRKAAEPSDHENYEAHAALLENIPEVPDAPLAAAEPVLGAREPEAAPAVTHEAVPEPAPARRRHAPRFSEPVAPAGASWSGVADVHAALVGFQQGLDSLVKAEIERIEGTFGAKLDAMARELEQARKQAEQLEAEAKRHEAEAQRLAAEKEHLTRKLEVVRSFQSLMGEL